MTLESASNGASEFDVETRRRAGVRVSVRSSVAARARGMTLIRTAPSEPNCPPGPARLRLIGDHVGRREPPA